MVPLRRSAKFFASKQSPYLGAGSALEVNTVLTGRLEALLEVWDCMLDKETRGLRDDDRLARVAELGG
jgi:hypothetical protein